MATALVLHGADAEVRAWSLRWDRDNPQMVDERVALAIASAYIEGQHTVATQVAEALGGPMLATWKLVDARGPGYHELRSYLVGDHNVNPVLAARVAMKLSRGKP